MHAEFGYEMQQLRGAAGSAAAAAAAGADVAKTDAQALAKLRRATRVRARRFYETKRVAHAVSQWKRVTHAEVVGSSWSGAPRKDW